MMKEELMESMGSPMKMLRQFPNLRAREVVAEVMKILPVLEESLVKEIVEHAK